jgi:hypothetical protein
VASSCHFDLNNIGIKFDWLNPEVASQNGRLIEGTLIVFFHREPWSLLNTVLFSDCLI